MMAVKQPSPPVSNWASPLALAELSWKWATGESCCLIPTRLQLFKDDWRKKKSYYFGNNVAQTTRGNLITLSHRQHPDVFVSATGGGGALLPIWRHRRAIIQTNYEINNLEEQVCVSNCSFMAPSWTLSPGGDPPQSVSARASAVSLIVPVTRASGRCRCNDISGVCRKNSVLWSRGNFMFWLALRNGSIFWRNASLFCLLRWMRRSMVTSSWGTVNWELTSPNQPHSK